VWGHGIEVRSEADALRVIERLDERAARAPDCHLVVFVGRDLSFPESGRHPSHLRRLIRHIVTTSQGTPYRPTCIATHSDVVINQLGEMIARKALTCDALDIIVLDGPDAGVCGFDEEGMPHAGPVADGLPPRQRGRRRGPGCPRVVRGLDCPQHPHHTVCAL